LCVVERSEVENDVRGQRNSVAPLIEDGCDELVGGTSNLGCLCNGVGDLVGAWDTVGEDSSVVVSLINVDVVSTNELRLEGRGNVSAGQDTGSHTDGGTRRISNLHAGRGGCSKWPSVVVDIDGLNDEGEGVVNCG
jgi:hypothetical protein